MASWDVVEFSEALDLARITAVNDKSWWEATWSELGVKTLEKTDELEPLVDFAGSVASLDVVEFSKDFDMSKFTAVFEKSWCERLDQFLK